MKFVLHCVVFGRRISQKCDDHRGFEFFFLNIKVADKQGHKMCNLTAVFIKHIETDLL